MEDCKRNNNDRRDSGRRMNDIPVDQDRRKISRRSCADRRDSLSD